MLPQRLSNMLFNLFLLGTLPITVLGADVLKTNGFSSCLANGSIQVQKLNIEYNKATNKVVFDVAGTSSKQQNVTASMVVMAYGREVYRNDFNPCEAATFVQQLCPVPAGTFSAQGSQDIPGEYASKIPGIAFSVPDLDGQAKLELKALEGGQSLACIESSVNNGKSVNVPAVSYVAAGVAGAALVLSGLSALGAGGQAGATTPSPTFGEVMGWFQSIAMNGMMSVQYPSVYRSFTKNFAFSGGLIEWYNMQKAIDNFRGSTGGNLTVDSIDILRNSTLVYGDPLSTVSKRSIEEIWLFAREINTSVNSTGTEGNGTGNGDQQLKFVKNIQGYAESLMIPSSNIFMTVLLIFAIVIAAITVGILLFKVILETWALFGTFPKGLTTFRKRYWLLLSKTITNLILLLYGVWALYCVYQFTKGDSWAVKLLAGVTLGAFTLVLAFFSFRIWQVARKFKHAEGNSSALFEDKETWRKYSLFYENYKKSYWWLFIPTIVYMLAKGCIIAGADGHGMVQAAGQLIVEALLLILLLWSRPYSLKSGNWINIIIQVVRVLSVVCILVFVQELGISQTTKTVTGLVLVVVQSVLTGLLAILIAVNSIIVCCRENPHRKRRKEAEKLNRDLDNLTPLDARNSLLMDPSDRRNRGLSSSYPFGTKTGYDPIPLSDKPYGGRERIDPNDTSREGLLHDAGPIGGRGGRSISPPAGRAPQLPNVEGSQSQQGVAYRGTAY
jgi:hypothetical protein